VSGSVANKLRHLRMERREYHNCEGDAVDVALTEGADHLDALTQALSSFLADPDFDVAVGGNPNMVDRMLSRSRAALAKARGDA